MSFIATEGERIVGVLLNKVIYKCDDANIVSFKEAVREHPDNFIWDILNFMDFLYKVSEPIDCTLLLIRTFVNRLLPVGLVVFFQMHLAETKELKIAL